MKSRQGYKGYVIVARSYELENGGFSAEFSVEEHAADGFMETEFYLPDTFVTAPLALRPTRLETSRWGLPLWLAAPRSFLVRLDHRLSRSPAGWAVPRV
jgi:hypothetical protein